MRVTRSLALVDAAVELASAFDTAVKTAFECADCQGLFARHLPVVEGVEDVSSLIARHLLMDLAAVAPGVKARGAASAKTGMTCLLARMITAREQVSADFLTTPTVLIVRVGASLSHFVFAAKAGLTGAHQVAGRARSSVTLGITRVRTGFPRLHTSLAARMRWQAGGVLRVDVLAAPTVVRARLVCERRIAAWAPPSFEIFLRRLVLPLDLALVPFLDAR